MRKKFTVKTVSAVIISISLVMTILFSSCGKTDNVVGPTPTGGATGKYLKTYGGGASDLLTGMIPVIGGGYLMTGYTVSFGAGDNDVYLVKTSAAGDVVWSKSLNITGNDECTAVVQQTDGSFIITGQTSGTGTTGSDIFAAKIDATGNSVWVKYYKIAGDQFANSVVIDTDGGLVIGGYSNENSSSGDDAFAMKIAADGTYAWHKVYGGQYNDYCYKLIKTSQGGFLAAGMTWSFGATNGDIYLLKLDNDGGVNWSMTYGGSDYEQANDVIETSGHDYVVAGYTKSFGLTDGDMIIFKTDNQGIVYTTEGWPRTIGLATGRDEAFGVVQNTDGSFFLTGKVVTTGGNDNIFFAHYFSDSQFDYARSYGAGANSSGNVIMLKSDGCIVAGTTADVGAGNNDMFSMGFKKDSDNKLTTCQIDNVPVIRPGSPTMLGATATTSVYSTGTALTVVVTNSAVTASTTANATCTTE